MADDQALINTIITLASRIALAHEELMLLRHGGPPESLDDLSESLDRALSYLDGGYELEDEGDIDYSQN